MKLALWLTAIGLRLLCSDRFLSKLPVAPAI